MKFLSSYLDYILCKLLIYGSTHIIATIFFFIEINTGISRENIL